MNQLNSSQMMIRTGIGTPNSQSNPYRMTGPFAGVAGRAVRTRRRIADETPIWGALFRSVYTGSRDRAAGSAAFAGGSRSSLLPGRSDSMRKASVLIVPGGPEVVNSPPS
jgi:hypothetical protein